MGEEDFYPPEAQAFHYYEYGACECFTCQATDAQVDAHKARIAAEEIGYAIDLIETLGLIEFGVLAADELGWA